MISYKDLCILKLTGILESYNKKEFIIPEEMTKGQFGGFFTCEFLKDSKCIIRSYYSDGSKYWMRKYKNGLRYGKSIGWYKNGNKWWETEFKDGKVCGKSTQWNRSGEKYYEARYYNNRFVKRIF